MRRMFSKNQLEEQNIELLGSGNVPSVKADEIIENMVGYSFTKGSEKENLTKEYIYSGVVKTGNKITFVVAFKLTRTGTITGADILGSFTIPKSVGDKLYPTQIGNYEGLDVRNVFCANQLWSGKDILTRTLKTSDTSIQVQLDEDNSIGLNSLTANTEYFARYEITFLLSENLVS